MMTCKDCIHYDVCGSTEQLTEGFIPCNLFKDKSRFVELPCKVSDAIFFINTCTTAEGFGKKYVDWLIVDEIRIFDNQMVVFGNGFEGKRSFDLNGIGLCFYLTRKEAEASLKERERDAEIH